LFRSIGTATLVAGCVKPDPSTQTPTPSGTEGDGSFGLSPAPLAFKLDGASVELQAEARTTLLELLRLDLDHTGSKLVCDRGACGACMVLVDGVARNSCMLLAHDVAGCEVTTVAGLGTSGELSALQRAFVDHDALQCGFCTSGMLISATGLLRQRAGATLERREVEHAIAGNLCRCGTYPHVVDAVIAVANGSTGRLHPAELIRATANPSPSPSKGGA
jgi:aerobic-type carbon monoxide dehydrogenase small subunit (CoxS/CutS family)